MSEIVVQGMHGMGDNIHQRGLVRHAMKKYDRVWLETPWPCIYHDFDKSRLLLFQKSTKLRTQRKNIEREAQHFVPFTVRRRTPSVRIWYRPAEVIKHGSIVAAMAANLGIKEEVDFRLPIPDAWLLKAAEVTSSLRIDKPIMIYRPLVDRTEWGGCTSRNPDPVAYYRLFHELREDYFVISVADLVPDVEWESGIHVLADAEFHKGELDFETLAALTSVAALSFCSPGFLVVLSQAVGTPVIAVHGGHESSRAHSYGSRFAPYLGVDPINPCECYQHKHNCDKSIDMGAAIEAVRGFSDAATARHLAEDFAGPRATDRLEEPAA